MSTLRYRTSQDWSAYKTMTDNDLTLCEHLLNLENSGIKVGDITIDCVAYDMHDIGQLHYHITSYLEQGCDNELEFDWS